MLTTVTLRRAFAVLFVIGLMASGCTRRGTQATGPTTGKYGSGVNLNFDKDTPPEKAQEIQQQVAQQAASQGKHAYGGTAGGPPPKQLVIKKKPLDNGTTGGNAYWYLNRTTPALDIEIDAIEGMAPSQQTISLLNQRLNAVADKPGGIRFLPIQTIPRTMKDEWTTEDVTRLEDRYRNTHNSLDRASMWIVFVNGKPQQEGVLGVAYSSSADVIFEDQVRGAATPIVTAQSIEQAVVIHEVGHLLSLVNMTYKSPRPHEDPNHPGHSKNQASVMFWALDNVGVATLLGGRTQPPTTYDADDLADLRDVRDGKLGPH